MACCDGDRRDGAETVVMCGNVIEGADTSTIVSAKSASAPICVCC